MSRRSECIGAAFVAVRNVDRGCHVEFHRDGIDWRRGYGAYGAVNATIRLAAHSRNQNEVKSL